MTTAMDRRLLPKSEFAHDIAERAAATVVTVDASPWMLKYASGGAHLVGTSIYSGLRSRTGRASSTTGEVSC